MQGLGRPSLLKILLFSTGGMTSYGRAAPKLGKIGGQLSIIQ